MKDLLIFEFKKIVRKKLQTMLLCHRPDTAQLTGGTDNVRCGKNL